MTDTTDTDASVDEDDPSVDDAVVDDAVDDDDAVDGAPVEASTDVDADEPTEGQVPTARAVLVHLVSSLVDDPDAVRVHVGEGRSLPRLTVRVGPTDMGRVIGKRGRVAQAIRTVTRAAAVRDGTDVEVEFED